MTASMAFIVATGDSRSPVDLLMEALRAQTIRSELEVVVVRITAEAPPIPLDLSEHFHTFEEISDLDAISPDRALATGFQRTTAPLVCLLEDHAFPTFDCAERLVEAFGGPWTVVGCAIENANVGAARLAQANMYVGYGAWACPVIPGEQDDLPNHNVAYRRSALDGRDPLATLLERGSGFHETLSGEGARFYLSSARVRHINPSSVRASAAVRFAAGRLYGADRALNGSWTAPRRLVYALASPLIPLVRFGRLARERFGTVERTSGLWPRLAPAVLLTLVFDAAGQAVGYLTGRGDASRQLADAETHRVEYVNRADRRAYFDS